MTGPVINYTATLATEGQANTSVSTGTNLFHNFTGLTPGTRYTVRIRAETRKETNVELGTVGATSDAFPFYTSAFFVCFFVLVCVSLSLCAFFSLFVLVCVSLCVCLSLPLSLIQTHTHARTHTHTRARARTHTHTRVHIHARSVCVCIALI